MSSGDIPLVNNIKQSGEAASRLNDSVRDLTKSYSAFGDAVYLATKGGKDGLNDLIQASGKASEGIRTTIGLFSNLAEGIPGLGGAAAVFQEIVSSTVGFSSKLFESVGRGTQEVIDGLDSQSKALREVDSSMFNVTKSFGEGIGVARDFTASISAQSLTDFAKAAYISTDDLKGFIEATKGSNLSLSTLSQTISTVYGNLDFYTVALLQASAAGISVNESTRLLDVAINKQGLAAQTALEVMSGFSEVSRETGISFSTVANTLNNAANQFSKLGMSAEFGRPILENFAKTVKEVGLGIDVATESTASLVSAMGGLSDNYGLAYLTQIRGGGGATSGVLGTSIEMRQGLREAEESGDQGSIALKMANQIKEAISSLTGGNIITLEQAAKSPDLQSQFYMQGQLLSQYGIRDTGTQDAVLDLLSKIDEAGISGNMGGQEELAKQLSMEIEGREKIINENEKLGIEIGSLKFAISELTRPVSEISRSIAGDIRGIATDEARGAYENLAESISENMPRAIETLSGAINSLKLLDIKELKDLFIDSTSSITNNANDIVDSSKSAILSIKDDIKEALKEALIVKIELSQDAQRLVAATASSPAPTLNN
jgi:hypothetical protein